MLEKISVRKPFTVLVGVILIVVLGLVSFTRTSTDLIPSINLPVAAVFTMYPGATPEQVELEVSVPLEQVMGGVTGVDSIISISAEHFSVMIVTFIETMNMDSASLEMRESLDMAFLPDGANKPVIFKLNPDMMPVMAMALSMENMEQDELSELARDELVPILTGVPGVASVTPSGLIDNQLHVIINSEKIESVNKDIANAFAAMLEEATAAAMAEMEAAVAAMVEERMAAYSEERMTQFMRQGFSVEEAGARLEAELPAVAEQMAMEISAEIMAASMPDGDEAVIRELPEAPGLPAELLSIEAISGILQAQNFSMPAGMLEDEDTAYMVRVGDKFTQVSDIENTLILDFGAMGITGAEPIRLKDVADIFTTDTSGEQYTRMNGNPTIMLMFQKQTNFSTSDVTADIRARMGDLAEEYEGLDYAFLMDQGEYVGIIIDSVLSNLIWGGLLAVLILLIFLWDIRPTLVVAVSIPVSLMLAFTLMYFTGISLNILSMSGLALAVGMLVDNSIVVIENIYRIRSKGDSAARASVIGARQVAGAITASTLTTICVFLPIVFTQGLTRQLFTDLGLTIAYALVASLLIAITVVPAASSALFKNVAPHQSVRFNKIRDIYVKMLKGALRFRWVVVIGAMLLFAGSVWAAMQRGTQLFPAMESPQMSVTATMPEGALFEEAVAVAEQLSERLMLVPDIETVGVMLGGDDVMGMMGGLMGGGGGDTISVYLLLSEERTISNDEIVNLIYARTDDLECEISVTGGSEDMMSMMSGDPISIRIEGRELDDIRDTAVEVAELISTVPGAINITDMEERGAPELRIRIDNDAARAKGLTVAQVFMAVSGTLNSPTQSSSIRLEGKSYELLVEDGDYTQQTRAGLNNIMIPNMMGELVQLSDVAEVYEDTGFTAILRQDRNRFLTISGEIAEGYNVGLVNAEIEKLLEDYTPKPGCRVIIGGEAIAIADAFSELFLMLALGLLFIYLIMVAQFQSLLSPFIILFTIPLAFTGGFLALLIAGMPISVVSVVGFVLLVGVVVNNGIVFVDRINQQRREEGLKKRDAIINAGSIRLRPIFMTALTTIAAMSVMALGRGMGTEMSQPMAVVAIGGLIYATLMTIFVVPCVYDIMHRDKPLKVADIEDL